MQKHIVDVLLEERLPGLSTSAYWLILKPVLHWLLDYQKACEMADMIAPLSGSEALQSVNQQLRMKVRAQSVEHIPEQGRCIIVCNHPTGIVDGLAMYDAVLPRRPDICFLANADAHRVCPGFDDVLIPVVWPATKRTLQSTKVTLIRARDALTKERAVVIFPAGALARRRNGVIQDPQWEPSAVSLARKYNAPLIPANLSGPFPLLFHLFDLCSDELRAVTLFHELFNKVEAEYTLIFGPPIDSSAIDTSHELVTAKLKTYIERELPKFPGAAFV